MTPALPLFDPELERMFVAAVIRDPGLLLGELEDFEATFLTDYHALAAFTALRNVEADGQEITADAIYERLLAELLLKEPVSASMPRDHREHPLSWFSALVDVQTPDDPPIYSWANQIIRLKSTQIDAVQAADRPPKRAPRGPRADGTEPVQLAQAFLRYAYTLDDEPTLVRWARAWWRYDGIRYVELDDELLDRDIIRFLDICVAPQGQRDPVTGKITQHLRRVVATTKHINDVRRALIGVAPVVATDAPHWITAIDGDPDPQHVAVCKNGILDLDTLSLAPRSPRLFATTALGAAWDPDSPQPQAWLDFLTALWGNDSESKLVLQQIFGYLLTPDTSLQKIFAMIGPMRSGKGTIARVLKALLGNEAVVNPTLASLEQPFGLAPLVGRSVAVIGDARLGGKQDQAQVVERLLSISGEDPLSINRKNRDEITVRLRTRVLLISNELPRLYDTSGALASRFVILSLSRSFLGREDTQLERKLTAELPGILRWAIEGRQDLLERGRFVEPLASEVAQRHLREVSSPIGSFLEESCRFGAELEVERDALYDVYKGWCKASGIDHPRDKAWFGRDLHTLHPEVLDAQRRRADGRRYRVYTGVSIQ